MLDRVRLTNATTCLLALLAPACAWQCLEGTVRAVGGSTVAGARVAYIDGAWSKECLSDAQGRYRFEDISLDMERNGAVVAYSELGLAVDSTARQLRHTRWGALRDLGALTFPELTVDADEVPVECYEPGRPVQLDLLLVPWTKAEGRLLTVDGQPLPGARVALWRLPVGRGEYDTAPVPDGLDIATTSDAEGYWTCPRWPACDGVLVVTHPDRVVVADDDGQLWANRRPRYWLQPGARLGGTVTDRAGRPVAGALVVAVDGGDGPCASARSDSRGRYQLPCLAERPYQLCLSAVGSPVVAEPLLLTDADFGGRPVNIAAEPGVVVDVNFVDVTNGHGVGGVEVAGKLGGCAVIAPHSPRSEADGRIRLRGLPGEYFLKHLAPYGYSDGEGQSYREGKLVAGSRPARLTIGLLPGRTVTGRLTEAGRPAPGLLVDWLGSQQMPQPTDAQGYFTLRAVPWRHDQTIVITEASGAIRAELRLDVPALRGRPWLAEVPPMAHCEVRGRVLDDQGRPAAGLGLTMKGAGEGVDAIWCLQTTTDTLGRFGFTATQAPPRGRTATLDCSGDQRHGSAHWAGRLDDALLDLPDLTVESRDAALRVRVVDSDRQPAFYAAVGLANDTQPQAYDSGSSPLARTGQDGLYTRSNLAHGRHLVVAGSHDRYGEALVDTEAAEPTDLVLQTAPVDTEAVRRAVASAALRGAWAAWPAHRPRLLAPLAGVDPEAAGGLLATLPTADSPAHREQVVVPLLVAMTVAPEAMATRLDLAEAWPAAERAAVRWVGGLALADGPRRDLAAQLLDTTPLPERATPVARATRALLALRLGRAEAEREWTAALAVCQATTDPNWRAALAWFCGRRFDCAEQLDRLPTEHSRSRLEAVIRPIMPPKLAQAVSLAPTDPDGAVEALMTTDFGADRSVLWARWLPLLAARPGPLAEQLRGRLPGTARILASLLAGPPAGQEADLARLAVETQPFEGFLPLVSQKAPDALSRRFAADDYRRPTFCIVGSGHAPQYERDLDLLAARVLLDPGAERTKLLATAALE